MSIIKKLFTLKCKLKTKSGKDIMRKKTLRAKNSENIKNAFSLMEMMIVLLIVAIVAAATAPMVTKKMSRNTGSGDSPWVFTGFNNSIAYNMGGNDGTIAIIGAPKYDKGDNGPSNPRLVLAGGKGLVFADKNGKCDSILSFSDDTIIMGNSTVGKKSVAIGKGQSLGNDYKSVTAVGFGTSVTGNVGVAIGARATAASYAVAIGGNDGEYNYNNEAVVDTKATASGEGSIAIGSGLIYISTEAKGQQSIALGAGSNAIGDYSIAIGSSRFTSNNPNVVAKERVKAEKDHSTAIGAGAQAGAYCSTAIGSGAKASDSSSTAIGSGAKASASSSTAIGAGAEATTANQIVLGTSKDTVYIPGHLVVRGDVALGSYPYKVYISTYGKDNGRFFFARYMSDGTKIKTDSWYDEVKIGENTYSKTSDRRLKNVGEKYTAGLNELKKLDFFHYTFKKDESKTPMVGVMAQDLQKVFPDAVTNGDDGYLRIRLEDMFYAVINAVKELDTKICAIVKNVTDISAKLDAQQKTIEEQQKAIKELQAQTAEFEKRLAKLENNKCKK